MNFQQSDKSIYLNRKLEYFYLSMLPALSRNRRPTGDSLYMLHDQEVSAVKFSYT